MNPPTYITVRAYAAKHGVHAGTVHKWLEVGGILTSFRVGRVIRILDVPPGSTVSCVQEQSREAPTTASAATRAR